MALHTVDMIRRLASGVRPDGGRPSKGTRPFETLGFDALLMDAARDVRPTGRPVHLGAGLEFDLNEEEASGLSLALDRAEAKGVEQLLALTARGVMVLDVHERTIRSLDDASDDDVRTGIDGAVVLGGIGGGDEPKGASAEDLARGLRRYGSASLVRVLAQREESS